MNTNENKRLLSLQKKRQEYRTKQQLIQKGLDAIHIDNTKNKKIVFDDDIVNINEIPEKTSDKKASKKKKPNLFESEDEEEDEHVWDKSFEKSAKTAKIEQLQSKIGYDKRFAVDERFLDKGDDETEQPQVTKESEGQEVDEKTWQLQMLENVLGKPLKRPMSEDKWTAKRKKMTPCDPVVDKTIESNKENKPVENKPVESKPVNHVNDEQLNKIYTEVTNKFEMQSEGEFSIFKLLNRELPTTNDTAKEETINETFDKSFKSDPKEKNPFLYDSSDNEEVEDENVKEETITTVTCPQDDRLFFSNNDLRFNQAIEFFSKNLTEQQEFKHIRRELKQIVRSKIKNNLKKAVPWNRKRVQKVVK